MMSLKLIGICIELLTLVYLHVTLALSFNHPYFLIMGENKNNILIGTDSCISGAFSNGEVKLTKFCVTGIWIIIDAHCATEQSQKYLVSGKDSCFELASGIAAKRFMPILQKTSDFEGYAFAFPKTYGYFVRLNPDNRTELKPIAQPRSEWTIMTINFGLFGRYINEFTVKAKNEIGSRTCYAPEPAVITQFFNLKDDGDTVIEPYRESDGCRTGFNMTHQSFDLPTGSVRSLTDDSGALINSTHSFWHVPLKTSEIKVPFMSSTASGPCSGDKEFVYPPYNDTLPYSKFPMFPHMFPPSHMDNIIVDEIQETAQKYIERKLFNTDIPKINQTEYMYILLSTKILGRFCCNPVIKSRHLDVIRMLFRLSASYYFQYHPYEEPKDEKEEKRILQALTTCFNRTDIPQPCVYVNDSSSCPRDINSTSFNGTFYEYNMPVDIQFELGNLDYVTEAIWKSMLFVHYYCASFFDNPSDHSAFNVKVEGFFNPLVKTKWTQPKSVHMVYELLLNEIALKPVAETIDHCVDAAQQASQYMKWLERPDSIEIKNRKKRDTKSKDKNKDKNKDQSNKDTDSGESCVPQSAPKLFCMNKQFDIYDNKLLNPFQPSPACNNVYSKKRQYEYIHANYYGSSYNN